DERAQLADDLGVAHLVALLERREVHAVVLLRQVADVADRGAHDDVAAEEALDLPRLVRRLDDEERAGHAGKLAGACGRADPPPRATRRATERRARSSRSPAACSDSVRTA